MPGIQDAIAAIVANQAEKEHSAPAPDMAEAPGVPGAPKGEGMPEGRGMPTHQPMDKGALLMALETLIQMLSNSQREKPLMEPQKIEAFSESSGEANE